MIPYADFFFFADFIFVLLSSWWSRVSRLLTLEQYLKRCL